MLNRKWIAGAVCVAAMAVSTIARAEARVYFEAPSDGATVSNPVHVKFGLEGMALKPAGDMTPKDMLVSLISRSAKSERWG